MTAPFSGADASVDRRLLAIAADHLRRFGARRITVIGVAETAGMTHANVYRYFPSKAALINAVAAQWLKSLETFLAEIADAPDPADDKLERLILAVAHAQRDLLTKDPNLFEVYAEAARTSHAMIRKHRARLKQLIDWVVDEGIGAGMFELRDREQAPSFITDAVFRFINPVAVRLDSDMPRALFDARLGASIRIIQRVLATGIV